MINAASKATSTIGLPDMKKTPPISPSADANFEHLKHSDANGLKWRKDKQHQYHQNRKRCQKWITPAFPQTT